MGFEAPFSYIKKSNFVPSKIRSEEIDRQIADFLAKGGEIKKFGIQVRTENSPRPKSRKSK